jgi:hypothetical protein
MSKANRLNRNSPDVDLAAIAIFRDFLVKRQDAGDESRVITSRSASDLSNLIPRPVVLRVHQSSTLG